ncbi:TfoX/Sxy family protein [Aliiroseovarius lamellibrachiae]|uniref:TfoX/Sxy family protein n=1 Tax=Aliiroseovarius lamellibrachiae TaxID=1924933 RepID=UPI001BE0CB9C|nr:TfoX/Sxy family protein [Aliiroseovarius lamellibrachiae]MBT2132154.1 TfoX/Sxy family protein [Aliiroseovarius lamellibrachiae]
MAYDPEIYECLAHDLIALPGISEKKMFGGIAFMLNGNMLCGVHKGGAMYRVGKDQEAKALARDGVAPMNFTGRRMGGFVDATRDAIESKTTRLALLSLATSYVTTLPAK